MVEPLFTVADLLRAVNGLDDLPENRPQVRTKARASGIANCARQIAYYMTNTPATDPGRPDAKVTTEQGRIMEDLSIAIVEALGFEVVNRQIELPEDYPLTGHPDGEIPTDDGLKWGFEHKHLGRWAYEKVFKVGLERGEPGYLAQSIAYADALGWDAVMMVIMAQDASSTASDATQNLRAKNPAVRWAVRPDWDPKYQVIAMDMRPYKDGLAKRIRQRGEWFINWAEAEPDPDAVVREYDAESESKSTYFAEGDKVVRTNGPPFPCSHCPWLQRCLEVGQGTIGPPELPLKVGDEPIGAG